MKATEARRICRSQYNYYGSGFRDSSIRTRVDNVNTRFLEMEVAHVISNLLMDNSYPLFTICDNIAYLTNGTSALCPVRGSIHIDRMFLYDFVTGDTDGYYDLELFIVANNFIAKVTLPYNSSESLYHKSTYYYTVYAYEDTDEILVVSNEVLQSSFRKLGPIYKHIFQRIESLLTSGRTNRQSAHSEIQSLINPIHSVRLPNSDFHDMLNNESFNAIAESAVRRYAGISIENLAEALDSVFGEVVDDLPDVDRTAFESPEDFISELGANPSVLTSDMAQALVYHQTGDILDFN